MKGPLALLLGTLLSMSTVQAEAPVFRNQVLAIEKAIVFNEDEAAYYADIRLQANNDGTFSIVSAARRNLAPVAGVDVRIAESFPVQILVSATGVLSVACVALEDPAVTRTGNTFHVVLAETSMPPGSVCNSLVATTPYEVTIPLDTRGLPAGTYQVDVNGLVAPFTL